MSRVSTRVGAALVACALMGAWSGAGAQTLRTRIDAAPPGTVEFNLPAAPGVCGNGSSYIRMDGPSTGVAVMGMSTSSAMTCEPGPVRVAIDRDGDVVVAVRTFVGTRSDTGSGTDLGRVAPQLGADYLLDLAARGEGRVGRDALQALALADSIAILEGLIRLAQNRNLPRETRTAALSQLPRTSTAERVEPGRVERTLLALAQDAEENAALRRHALSVLGRLEQGAGVPRLVELTTGQQDVWVAREAMTVLAASGDPRARAHLRAVIQRDNERDELRRIAIRGLGQRFATAQDAALLRTLYPRLTSAPTRDAAVASLADIGGATNVSWLMDFANNADEPVAERRRALDAAARAGARLPDLIRLYDRVGDQQLKDALITIFGRADETAATDKLIEVARTETNLNVRRRAISTLSNSADPRVQAVLQELVQRR